ncbi:MAG: tRNA lysidine(34) synthetase TilS [bacterium]|nr:tRNA lysidine(34) synthetase TilS [bacterium]
MRLFTRACPHVERPGLLIALSGGPDSVALLLGAKAWAERNGGHLAAAHLDHGLRGADATADANFCRDLCRRLDVSLHVESIDPRAEARSRGGGLEEAARHLRRRVLEKLLANDSRLHAVATGHHLDDQAETVLMRLLRGAGPAGLRGIRPVAGPWLHPLLEKGRAEIVAFLEAAGQPWRQDVTNLDGDNVRARLRRELLPVARDIFGAGTDLAPARLAQLLDDELELLAELTDDALAAVGDAGSLDVAALLGLRPALARRVLLAWLRDGAGDDDPPADLGRVHLEATLAWLRDGTSGSGLDLPGGERFVREFDRLRRERRDDSLPLRQAADYRILVGNESPAGDVEQGHGDPGNEATWVLTCPARALSGNLRVRNWREGDRFRPLGLDGSKKLSDLFRERRLPAADRPGVLVVEDGEGILWVVGLARAERTRLLPTGGPTVTMRVVSRNDPMK